MFLLSSCGKDPSTEPAAPSAITLSASSLTVEAAGGSYDVTVTAPVRPQLTLPTWITKKEGTYGDYKLTVTLQVAENTSYMARSGEVTVYATGASPVILKVEQAGAANSDANLPDNDAVAMSNALGLGWNLGNHFDAYYNGSWAGEMEGYPGEEVWGNAVATKATFTAARAAGFTTLRLPVSWLRMIGPAPDYRIDETWLNRVYEVAGWAHEAGMNVIVNTHHDENHGVDNTYQWLDIKNAAKNEALDKQIQEEIAAVWTQIARKFADCGDWLIMESFNEINDGGWGWSDDFRKDPTRQCNILNQWNQVFVDAVRSTGGNNATRWLGVPTYAANPEYEKYMVMPKDPAGKLMLAVHFYDPYGYTLGEEQYSDWGHTGAAGKKASGGDEDHVQEVFNNLFTKYVQNNIPVYLGECGSSMRSPSDERAWAFYLYYMEYIVKAAKSYGMSCILWDNGARGEGQECHGYLDHGTGEYIGASKIPIDVMVKARFTTDPSYTLESVYNKAPKF